MYIEQLFYTIISIYIVIMLVTVYSNSKEFYFTR